LYTVILEKFRKRKKTQNISVIVSQTYVYLLIASPKTTKLSIKNFIKIVNEQ